MAFCAQLIKQTRNVSHLLNQFRNTTLSLNRFKQIHFSSRLHEIVSFKLSDIGEGIGEVTIKEWFVKVGDAVNQFDSICEVQSDKASVTITSRYDGVIKRIYYQIDDTALVGRPLVDIETNQISDTPSQIDEMIDHDDNNKSTYNEKEKHLTNYGKIITTPAVRRLASEHNIKLNNISGTGKDGRILKEDVLQYIEIANKNVSDDIVEPNQQQISNLKLEIKKAEENVQIKSMERNGSQALCDRIEPIKGIRKVMMKTMTQSLKVPHFSLSDQIDMTSLVKLRSSLKKVAQENDIKLSYMPFFIKAASLALIDYPIINSTLDEKCENIIIKSSHNIGVAIDTKQGLIVPNIKNVANLTILEIAEKLNKLQELALKGQLSTDDLSNGSFTFSNIGSIGGVFGIPVILTPEVAIGALGAIQTVPKFEINTNNIIKAEVLTVVWSADHRIIDGATMTRFSNKWKQYLETPSIMLCHMK